MIYAILSIIPGLGHLLQGRQLSAILWFILIAPFYIVGTDLGSGIIFPIIFHLFCIWNASQKLTTNKQKDFLLKLGYKGKFPILCKQSSKLIDKLLDKVPATNNQLTYLIDLGYRGNTNISKREASRQIDILKEKRSIIR